MTAPEHVEAERLALQTVGEIARQTALAWAWVRLERGIARRTRDLVAEAVNTLADAAYVLDRLLPALIRDHARQEAALRAVLDLHRPVELHCDDAACDQAPHSGHACQECGDAHPCMTVRAIEDALTEPR